MLKALFLSLVMISTAQATHLEDVCKAAVQKDSANNPPLFSSGYMSRIEGDEMIVETMDGQKLFGDYAEIKDMITTNDRIWVLNPFDVVELTKTGEVVGRYTFEPSNAPAWEGMGFALAGNTLLIAQGVGGLTGFDITTKTVKWHNNLPDVSSGMAVGVTTDGVRGYVPMATRYEGGFTGIATVNIEDGNVVGQTPYHRDWGVIDIEPKVSWYNNSLVMNNGGWIHVVTKKQIDTHKAVKPRWVAHVIAANGPVNQHYMMLTGGFFFEGTNLVGCGVYTAQEDGQFMRKSDLFKIKMP